MLAAANPRKSIDQSTALRPKSLPYDIELLGVFGGGTGKEAAPMHRGSGAAELC